MLVRYNSSFGALRMGMYFKYVNVTTHGLGGGIAGSIIILYIGRVMDLEGGVSGRNKTRWDNI